MTNKAGYRSSWLKLKIFCSLDIAITHWQGRSSRNSRYTEKLDRLPIWLSNTCHGTSTLQICKLMDRSTCLPISEAPRMFWNTSEETAFPELNLKLIVYMLFNNIFFRFIFYSRYHAISYLCYMHWKESTHEAQ